MAKSLLSMQFGVLYPIVWRYALACQAGRHHGNASKLSLARKNRFMASPFTESIRYRSPALGVLYFLPQLPAARLTLNPFSGKMDLCFITTLLSIIFLIQLNQGDRLSFASNKKKIMSNFLFYLFFIN